MSKKISMAAALCAGTILTAQAQVTTSWLPGNGSWSDSTKWSNGIPDSANADVIVDNQSGTNSVVTFTAPGPNNPVSYTVGRLRIDAGDKVDTGSTFGIFSVSNTAFIGAGELQINGTFAMPGDGRSLGGNPITINGSGSLVLGSSTARPRVETDLTNNATIEGAGIFGARNSSRYRTYNNGIITPTPRVSTWISTRCRVRAEA